MATKGSSGQEESAEATRQRARDRLGLGDPREGLLCLPAAYVDCRQPQRAITREDDEERRLYVIRLTGNINGFKGRKFIANLGAEGMKPHLCQAIDRLEVELVDERGDILVWSMFGSGWLARDLDGGDTIVLSGKVQWFGKRAFIGDIERPPYHALGKVWTRYLGIPGRVAGDAVEALVRSQLDNPDAWRWCVTKIVGATGMREAEALASVSKPGDLISFAGLEAVLRALHTPESPEHGWAARSMCNRLAALAVQASALRQHSRAAHPQAPLPVDLGQLESIASTQKETLTEEQWVAIRGIAEAFTDPKPLTGMLSGDVGTGKTLTYLIPLVAAYRAGARVAIIAPTDLLANQIALQAIERFGPHGVNVERIQAGARKISDQGAILVGTPGLTSVARRVGYTPQVLVCDEQHKMSTEVRECLVKPWTHVLEVSATPIPRTLAAALYGSMKTFTLRRPPVKKEIRSLVYDVNDRPRGVGMLKWVLQAGQKAAVSYPRVESKIQDVKTVQSAWEVLEKAFPGKVTMLHGSMSDKDKAHAMEQIKSGAKPIVVGSTVMETGIDIPSMAGMIVRDADRFGSSQLHQLRGRLARNGGEGWFIMMVDDLEKLPPETLGRLEAVQSTTDGYTLAELDLVQRGFGDLDGADQSGATETVFKLVRLRPEDFLRHKLASAEKAVERPSRAHEAADVSDERDRGQQPRLFG